jgi:Trp operon repressor
MKYIINILKIIYNDTKIQPGLYASLTPSELDILINKIKIDRNVLKNNINKNSTKQHIIQQSNIL